MNWTCVLLWVLLFMPGSVCVTNLLLFKLYTSQQSNCNSMLQLLLLLLLLLIKSPVISIAYSSTTSLKWVRWIFMGSECGWGDIDYITPWVLVGLKNKWHILNIAHGMKNDTLFYYSYSILLFLIAVCILFQRHRRCRPVKKAAANYRTQKLPRISRTATKRWGLLLHPKGHR